MLFILFTESILFPAGEKIWAFYIYVDICLTALSIIAGTLINGIVILSIFFELVCFPAAPRVWTFYFHAVLTVPSIVDGTVIDVNTFPPISHKFISKQTAEINEPFVFVQRLLHPPLHSLTSAQSLSLPLADSWPGNYNSMSLEYWSKRNCILLDCFHTH